VWLSAARQDRFPSVPDRPLQHLSALESMAYGRVDQPEKPNCDTRPNVLRSLTGTREPPEGDHSTQYMRWRALAGRTLR